MNPIEVIGRPYCLGGDFVNREGGDCVALGRLVLTHYGMEAPVPQRSWYRRLRKGDYSVFPDELSKWGIETKDIDYGTIALCKGSQGLAMASYFDRGWLSFQIRYGGSAVRWSPIEALDVVAFYCPRRSS